MNDTNVLYILTGVEAVMWFAVVVALCLGSRQSDAQIRGTRQTQQEFDLDSRFLVAFSVVRIASDVSYLSLNLLAGRFSFTAELIDRIYTYVYWAEYVVQACCVFLLIAALIRSCLRPLPGLSVAALAVFRWISVLAFVLAFTSHLPLFRVEHWRIWLSELSLSFQFCVCTFEITLLALVLAYMRKLGLFVRSRVIGFALGLAAFGLGDYLAGFLTLVNPDKLLPLNLINGAIAIFTIACWLYYIVMPEPKRQPHSLSPASSLMKWNEVAIKLGMGGRQAEQVPFISGVESKVDAVLERFKVRAG